MFEDELNPAQLAAATHGEGPLLIVAGAGTGKTTTLAARVAVLVERGVRPERILLVTFSRRAAREMVTRAEAMTGRRDAGRVWGGTFHALANRLLRLHGRALGLSPTFTVLDQPDGADVVNLLREELGFAARERRFPRKETLAAIHSRVVNAGTKLDEVLERHYPWCVEEADGIRAIFRAYVERKREQQTLDYDDLLLFWKALACSPRTGPQVAAMFDHILVDEYQDTNALQADILEAMRPEGTPRNLTVVGDDAQAIYGFRAATVRNILAFPERFPGARVVKLERNYRSSAPILSLSNAVIALSPQRHEKTLWTERTDGEPPVLRACLDEPDQADAVCRSVLEHREHGIALHEQAVLFRAAHHSDVLEVELLRRNIPFVKYGGLKFLEAAHVKDALALLRVLENPHDEVAWFRVLQLPAGVGPQGARRLMDVLGVRGSAGDPLASLLDGALPVPRGAGEGVRALRSALAGCLDETVLRPSAQLERLRTYLEPVIDAEVRGARAAHRRPRTARSAGAGLREPRPVPRRAHPRPSGVDVRPGGTAGAGRGLPDPVHDPFGEGPRVGRGPRDPRVRRMHPVRHGAARRRGARGGTPAPVRGAHARAAFAASVVPAAVLPATEAARRRAHVRARLTVPGAGNRAGAPAYGGTAGGRA